MSAPRLSVGDVVIEALKIIKNELLAYAVIVAVLLIGTAALGLEILKALRWPLVAVFTVALAAYFLARAVPAAKSSLHARAGLAGRAPDGTRR